MIKPDDIKKHTAEFFTSDPDFVLWCLDPERAQDGYWCGYTERHPQDLVEFERAVSLVRRGQDPSRAAVRGETVAARPHPDRPLRPAPFCSPSPPPQPDGALRRRFPAGRRRCGGPVLECGFHGFGLPSAEAYENITLVTREGSREVYDDIARISLTPKGRNPDRRQGRTKGRRPIAGRPGRRCDVHTSELVVPKGKRASATLRRDAGVDQFGVGAPFPVGVR